MIDPIVSKGVGGSRAVMRVSAPPAAAPIASVPQSPRRIGGDATDTASLSGVAAQLASKPPVDADRVAQIKHAIENGTFPILPATIADRLLALRYDWMTHEPQSF